MINTAATTDYSASDAEHDARMTQRVWVVVEDETGKDLTEPLTWAEASTFIMDMSMDPRPNAVKGWMHIEERDIQVFTDEEEELFRSMYEAGAAVKDAKITLEFQLAGVPQWRYDQMKAALEAAKKRNDELIDRAFETGMAKNYLAWRKLR